MTLLLFRPTYERVLTLPVQQEFLAFDGAQLHGVARPLGTTAMLADQRIGIRVAIPVRTPLPDRNTATKPVVIELLAFLNRNIWISVLRFEMAQKCPSLLNMLRCCGL